MSRSIRRSRPAAWLALLALGLGSVAGGGQAVAAAPDDSPPSGPSTDAERPNGDGPDRGPVGHTVTLVTGDRVVVGAGEPGRESIRFRPARRGAGSDSYEVRRRSDRTYVVPSTAREGLRAGVLDPALFDVTGLIEQDYDDAGTDTLPVILRHSGRFGALSSPATDDARRLPSIDATAVGIEKADAADVWDDLTVPSSSGPTTMAGAVEMVWLDGRVAASLDRSVPQIGAPAAWDAGLTGEGVTIGVVDTGVDADHPDLAGRVTASENFSESPDAVDRAGHGTHVASIAAGDGAASDGAYSGVAPDASIVSAKVLDDDGYGTDSTVIAGMEWAVAQGADVVNLSLGGAPTDGTGPVDQALNELSDTSGALFVVAAGNEYQAPESVGSPASADGALAVGAIDRDTTLGYFSSIGPRQRDGAIKPEITAPGTEIVAAQSSHVALPGPKAAAADEAYTTKSGTSMATPHVAGAAALLAQRYPDWTDDRLRTALMSTAVPHPDNTVYEQGAGLVDIRWALTTPVAVSAPKLDLGFFAWPQDGTEPVTGQLAYTNTSEQPLTLSLAAGASSPNGPAPDGSLALSRDTLEVAPGATETIEVTLDPAGLDPQHYGGYLTATVDGDDAPTATTPLGWYIEPEQYDVTIRGIDIDGAPADACVEILNLVDESWRYPDPYGACLNDGERTVRIPPGTYSMGTMFIKDPTDTRPYAYTLVVEPEVEITGDGDDAVVLDARDAEPVRFDVDGAPETNRRTVDFGYTRTGDDGQFGGAILGAIDTNSLFYATPTEPVTTGDMEYMRGARLEAPPLTLDVVGADDLDIDPRVMPFARRPAESGRFGLVAAGAGIDPSELEQAIASTGSDLDGVIALIERDDRAPAIQASEAARAGADLALMYTNDEPGRLGEWYWWGDETEPSPMIPIATTDRVAAADLLELLGAGPVEVDVTAVERTPFVYDLLEPTAGLVPDRPGIAVRKQDMARLKTVFGGHVPSELSAESRSGFTPLFAQSGGWLPPWFDSPAERTDYVQAGSEMEWIQSFLPYNEYGDRWLGWLSEVPRSYRQGERGSTRWLHPVATHTVADHPWYEWQGATRTGEELLVELNAFVDEPDRILEEGAEGDWHELRLYADDELLGSSDGPYGVFEVPAGPATYRMELDSQRVNPGWTLNTEVGSVWTMRSAGDTDGEERLPLLLIDYDVPASDATSRVWAGEPVRVDLTVDHQARAPDRPIGGARMEVSYDGGETWKRTPVFDTGDGAYVGLVLPPRRHAGGAVSLRTTVTDADGNRLVQTVTDAFGLK